MIKLSTLFERIPKSCGKVAHTEHGDVWCTRDRRHSGEHRADDGEGHVVHSWANGNHRRVGD